MSEKLEAYLNERVKKYCELARIPMIRGKIPTIYLDKVEIFLNTERIRIQQQRKDFMIGEGGNKLIIKKIINNATLKID